jgi:biopolymer transport protein ExbB
MLSLAASFPDVIRFFLNGGFFMIPLLLCSLTSGAVIILRGLALRRDLVMPPEIEREIGNLQPSDDSETVVRLARVVRNNESPLARIAHAGLQHLQWPKSENMDAVQTRARHEISRLDTGMVILEIIVGISPLLGLLGAVSGLVGVFASLGDSATVSDPRGIAKGISEALTTTVVGIAVAIPTLVAYSIFSKRIETLAVEMESLIAEMITKCYYQKARRAGLGKAFPEEEVTQ